MHAMLMLNALRHAASSPNKMRHTQCSRPHGTHATHPNRRNGVLQANWAEDNAGNEFKATGKHVLGLGAQFAGNSTQRLSYNEYGKTGADLEYISQVQHCVLHPVCVQSRLHEYQQLLLMQMCDQPGISLPWSD